VAYIRRESKIQPLGDKMKSLILIAFFFAVSSASAAHNKTFTVSMTGTDFVDDTINLMGDDMPVFDTLLVKLDGQVDQDFKVEIEPSSPDVHCDLNVASTKNGITTFEVLQDVDTDDGSNCSFHFTKTTGEQATLQIFSTGT
jgi:hypothetical protein